MLQLPVSEHGARVSVPEGPLDGDINSIESRLEIDEKYKYYFIEEIVPMFIRI
jgi:hypothetical protein